MIGATIDRIIEDSGADRYEGDEVAEAILTAIEREIVRLEFAKRPDRAAAFKIVADWMKAA